MSSISSNKIARRAFVAELLARRDGAFIVCGLGSPTWDCFAAGDSPEYLYSWGGMGLAVPTALGVALAQPAKRVVCVTGDGEMLMGIGALGVVADQAPANLGILVLDNERFGETGMQKTPTASGVDLAAIATACGIRTSRIVRTMAEVTELRDLAHEGRGTAFAQIKINPEALVFVMPPADGVILTSRFRQSVLGDEALFN
jgi:thiamine pyrophosphate-dependent acetolactate synthase large subunit-like protein